MYACLGVFVTISCYHLISERKQSTLFQNKSKTKCQHKIILQPGSNPRLCIPEMIVSQGQRTSRSQAARQEQCPDLQLCHQMIPGLLQPVYLATASVILCAKENQSDRAPAPLAEQTKGTSQSPCSAVCILSSSSSSSTSPPPPPPPSSSSSSSSSLGGGVYVF